MFADLLVVSGNARGIQGVPKTECKVFRKKSQNMVKLVNMIIFFNQYLCFFSKDGIAKKKFKILFPSIFPSA